MEWNEYLKTLLGQEISFDNVNISFDGSAHSIKFPPIIKASVLMLDSIQTKQSKNNIFVYPERVHSSFVFTFAKLMHNISEKKIGRNYSPDSFEVGELLSFGKAIVQFNGIEILNGKKHMRIKTADVEERAPYRFFPFFQRVKGKKKLSNYSKYTEAKKEAEFALQDLRTESDCLKMLLDYKTHMDSSIVYMTSIIKSKELINGCKISGRKLKELILVGQVDYQGEVINVSSSKFDGIPSIILASDLYSILELSRNQHPIQSIIVDVSNSNSILTQLDALGELMKLNVPITCITDTVNSFDLQAFLDRGFNLWRWDKNTITRDLFDSNTFSSNRKIKNCSKHHIEYLSADNESVSFSVKTLYRYKSDSQDFSPSLSKIYATLFTTSLDLLREITPIAQQEKENKAQLLSSLKELLEKERRFISVNLYEDISLVIDNLLSVYEANNLIKHAMLENYLLNTSSSSICLVVQEQADKNRVQEYWDNWISNNNKHITIDVFLPSEYFLISTAKYEHTIVVGWLKRAIMRKILYSYITSHYTILLCLCENRWKKYDTNYWEGILSNDHNKAVIEKSLMTKSYSISVEKFEHAPKDNNVEFAVDEYREIDRVIQENKYKQYVVKQGKVHDNSTVEAIPVNFIGGSMAFYRIAHKLLCSSKIIYDDTDNVETILPNKVKLGDFIVVRESERDLIKEIADMLLAKEGKSHLREIATKWKEALKIETLFYTVDEIYDFFLNAGCSRSYQTIKNWIMEDDLIAPQTKQDLEFIVSVTNSGVLANMLDDVYSASLEVKNAHKQAGKYLSSLLREKIVDSLKEYGEIDPFNIWEPISIKIDEVGTVHILKVIDIGAPVIVNYADTNRLIME